MTTKAAMASPLPTWKNPDPIHPPPPDSTAWAEVSGLEEQQRRILQRIHSKGVAWRNHDDPLCPGVLFRLDHGGEVEADGHCLFTAVGRAVGVEEVDVREMRRRAVKGFLEVYGEVGVEERGKVDEVVRHLYCPDLRKGWGVHVVQDVKVLARKEQRERLDAAIEELVGSGLQRENAAESVYRDSCISVSDGPSWAKYMMISGSMEDEFDIITLQYTEDGLLTLDENRRGHAAAFGDDIAIEGLAKEFSREIYVVQAHGSDAMVDEENCVFFLPHRPRVPICGPPIFLFMKGTGWCGAGADHYEPLIAYPIPFVSLDKAAVVL